MAISIGPNLYRENELSLFMHMTVYNTARVFKLKYARAHAQDIFLLMTSNPLNTAVNITQTMNYS